MHIPFSLPWRRPAGRSTTPESKSGGGFTLVAAEAGFARRTGHSYSAMAREGFMANPVAHRALRMVAEASASVTWLLYGENGEVEDHPLLALIRHPNAHMSGPDFFEALYGHLLLSGNAFIEPLLVGEELRELHLLRPDRVSVVEGRDGWPVGYDYRAGGASRRIAAGPDGGLIHLRLFHPLDDHLGFSPLAAAGAALDLHNAASHWNKRLLDNSARPSGALVYQPKEGGNLSPDQYERLKRELEEGYAGAVNAGRPLLLKSDAYL